MKYLRLFLSCLIVIGSLLFPTYILAQSNVQTEKTVRCLTNRPEDAGNKRSLTWHDPPSPKSIPKYLKGKFVPGSTVYAIACIGSGVGRICGTGDAAMDTEVFTNTTGITQAGTNQINVLFNQVKYLVDSTGIINVDAEVGGTTANSGAYDFFGVEIQPPIDSSLTGAGALQQATFKFDPESGKDCASISWTHHDPYGIVFDSRSLEPLGNVVVTIKNEAGVPLINNPVLRNNTPTGEDGVYNYLVPPGKYILSFQMPTGYQFTATPKASINMAQVYDFIDDNDTKNHCTIYKPNEVIDEKAGMPECRNVPLEPVSVPPLVKKPVSILYSFEKDLDKEVYIIKNGKVSHPLTTIIAYQKVSAQQKIELGRVIANNSGFYTLEIPFSKVLPDAPIEIEFKKSSLLGVSPQAKSPLYQIVSFIINRLIKSVAAQTTNMQSIVFDPLPTYIEGYAYDIAQQVIPNATVQVKLKNGDSIYFQTKADINGYFFIAPKNLPTSPLNLEFYLNFVKADGSVVKYHIYEFTRANKYYFSQENINLITGKKNGVVPVPQPLEKTALAVVPVEPINKGRTQQKIEFSNSPYTSNTAIVNPITKQPVTINQQIILIIILILVLAIVGATAVIMIVKNKPAQQI